MKTIAAIRRSKKVNSVLDERVPGDGSEDGGGNGIWAYLQPGWRCTLADSHACHEYTVEALAKAVRWAEPCPCEDCQKTPEKQS